MKCKDCKRFLPIGATGQLKKYKKEYKNFGECMHLNIVDDVKFLQNGEEMNGGFLVHESFGCKEFEKDEKEIYHPLKGLNFRG